MHMRGALLYVKDLARMRNFYGNLLGVGPSNQDSAATWATFDNGNVQLALHAIPRDIAAQIEIASPALPRETAPVKLIFEVEDVEDTRARIEALGAQCIRRPWQRPGAACDAIDPEGNIFQICASAQAEL